MDLPNTLGLDDDLDGVELVQSLEGSFGVKFSHKETEECYTVDDIFRLLQHHLGRDGVSRSGCATAMAFYRLRRVLTKSSVLPRLTPTTALKDISPLSPKALFQQLRLADPDIRLPRLSFTREGQIGRALLSLGIFGVIVAAATVPNWAAYAGLAAAVGAILTRMDRRQFPPACQSLGELARNVAGLNFGVFVASGAGYREKDLWCALFEVLAEHSSVPKTEIRGKTLLLQSQLRAA